MNHSRTHSRTRSATLAGRGTPYMRALVGVGVVACIAVVLTVWHTVGATGNIAVPQLPPGTPLGRAGGDRVRPSTCSGHHSSTRRLEDGNITNNGRKLPIQLYAALPLFDRTLMPLLNQQRGSLYPGSQYHVTKTDADGDQQFRRDMILDTLRTFDSHGCDVCVITLFVPRIDEHSSPTIVQDPIAQREVLSRLTPVAVDRELCGAVYRQVRVVSLVQQTGSIGEWLDLTQHFIAAEAKTLQTPTIVAFIDASMRPLEGLGSWMNTVAGSVSDAPQRRVIGCATVDRPPETPLITTIGLEPLVWQSRGAPVLRRTNRMEHINDAFRSNTRQVYSIQPTCWVSSAETFLKVFNRAQALPTRSSVKLWRRIAEFAVAAAGAKGTLEKATDMMQFVRALLIDAEVVAKDSPDPVFAKATAKVKIAMSQASRIIERGTLNVYPDVSTPHPLSNDAAHEFACVAPAMRVLGKLNKELGCYMREGEHVLRCGQAGEVEALEALITSGEEAVSTFRDAIVDFTPIKAQFEVAKTAMLSKRSDALAATRLISELLAGALLTSQRIIDRSIRRLRLACDTSTDFLPWTRLTFAARSLNLNQLVLKGSTVYPESVRVPDHVAGKVPATPEGWLYVFEFASTLKQAFIPIGVDIDDPNAMEAQRFIAGDYRTATARLHWQVPCCSCCGFSVEWSWIAQGLSRYVPTTTMTSQTCHCPGATPEHHDLLWGLYMSNNDPMQCQLFNGSVVSSAGNTAVLGPDQSHSALWDPPVEVEVLHWDPINAANMGRAICDTSRKEYTVSRSMYEFGSVPSEWIPLLNSADRYDEIWVPAEAVKEAFIRSGVNPGKIIIIPEPIDTERYSPHGYTLQLPHAIRGVRHAVSNTDTNYDQQSNNFKFLSIFKFEPRKGWDAMMTAYLSTFTADDRVSLYIVTSWWGEAKPATVLDDRDPYSIRHRIDSIAASLGKADRHKMPHFVIITHTFSDNDLIALYRSCDAFLLPSKGEGWGLPIIQAMAIGVPTITTRHSGMLQFTTEDTVIYVNVTVGQVPAADRKAYAAPENATWGEPDVEQIKTAMAHVRGMSLENRRQLAERARRHIMESFSLDAIGKQIANRLVQIELIARRRRRSMAKDVPFPPPTPPPPPTELAPTTTAAPKPVTAPPATPQPSTAPPVSSAAATTAQPPPTMAAAEPLPTVPATSLASAVETNAKKQGSLTLASEKSFDRPTTAAPKN
jgi:glycosyltransferase involved in cell wall biosynthesis